MQDRLVRMSDYLQRQDSTCTPGATRLRLGSKETTGLAYWLHFYSRHLAHLVACLGRQNKSHCSGKFALSTLWTDYFTPRSPVRTWRGHLLRVFPCTWVYCKTAVLSFLCLCVTCHCYVIFPCCFCCWSLLNLSSAAFFQVYKYLISLSLSVQYLPFSKITEEY